MRRETLLPLSILHRATEDTELSGYNIPKVSCLINLSEEHIKIVCELINQESFDAGHSDDRQPLELP
jgi:hypothetical protein